MLLGCITLGAALALCVGLQALFGWGRAQLDTGAALSADTLRLHIRAASDTMADQTDKSPECRRATSWPAAWAVRISSMI